MTATMNVRLESWDTIARDIAACDSETHTWIGTRHAMVDREGNLVATYSHGRPKTRETRCLCGAHRWLDVMGARKQPTPVPHDQVKPPPPPAPPPKKW